MGHRLSARWKGVVDIVVGGSSRRFFGEPAMTVTVAEKITSVGRPFTVWFSVATLLLTIFS